MRKLAPIFAFLIAATPAIVRAQDPLFDRINLKLRDGTKTVDVTVTKDGKATFVFPDRVVNTTLTADQLAHLERNVKGVFTRGSPATDLGGANDRPKFELIMEASNGTRWVAKGPVDLLRGGNLPAVYPVVRDLQALEKALPAPAERLALPAPAERLALPAPAERLALPAPAERLALPAPAATVPTGMVFFENGRRVTVLPESGELVVQTKDGTEYVVKDRAVVDALLKAATDARLADHSNNFRVNASNGSNPFKLVVIGEKGALQLDGPLDVSSWNSEQLRGSVGPLVSALEAISTGADRDHVAARAAAEEKTKGKPGLFGMNRFIESFKADAAKIQGWGASAFRFLGTTAIPKAIAFASSVGDFFKNAWDRFRGRGEAKDRAPVEVEVKDARGFSRTPGLAEALEGRVRVEAERSRGRAVK